mgnify:CR=1 FL=1
MIDQNRKLEEPADFQVLFKPVQPGSLADNGQNNAGLQGIIKACLMVKRTGTTTASPLFANDS